MTGVRGWTTCRCGEGWTYIPRPPTPSRRRRSLLGRQLGALGTGMACGSLLTLAYIAFTGAW